MVNIRRIYVYLVSAITLQAIVWAAIALLRSLLSSNLASSTSAIALQVAMILVGLPLYLAHWLWAQRSSSADQAERASAVRRLYLDAMLFAFIIPIIYSSRLFVKTIIESRLPQISRPFATIDDIRFTIIIILITGLMAAYHYRIRQSDDRSAGEEDATLFLDHILIYLLLIIGLILTAVGSTELIQLILNSFAGDELGLAERRTIAANLASIIAGFPLWIISWRQAQRRFSNGDRREKSSVVRKAALYLIVFVSSLTAVAVAAVLLANFLMRLLQVPSTPGSLFRALSIIVVSTVIWAYHAIVLQRDAEAAHSAGQAAAVRRIYLYLVSGVGLTAVLIGTGGVLSVLIRALDKGSLGRDLSEQLAWFTATLIAGLPVWLLSWRRIEHMVSEPGTAGIAERNTYIRRLYLYLFIFVAILTLLGGAVYVVSQFVELALGSRSSHGLLTDMGQALAYTLIAVAVLVYHGMLLRRDQRLIDEQETKELQKLNVAVVDASNGRLGSLLVRQLEHELPGLEIFPVPLSDKARESMRQRDEDLPPADILSAADIIVTPWQLAAGTQSDASEDDIRQIIRQSSAFKLILPLRQKGLTWIGVEPWQDKEIAGEVVEAIGSIAKGDKPSARHKLSTAAIVLIVLASLCGLTTILPLVIQLIAVMLGY